MSDSPKILSTGAMQAAVEQASTQTFSLILYVAGLTPASQAALRNARRICDEHLAGRYTLQVVDLYQQPELAARDQILAAPTLLRKLPLPLRRIIGSLVDAERVLVGLDVKVEDRN